MEPSDLALLSPLDALLQEGSVTKAARRAGLSTPAMSHALARLRLRLRDPLLVRAGRAMVLTPRAEQLKPRVHALVVSAQQTLAMEQDFSVADQSTTFTIRATDYVLKVLGAVVDRIVHHEAPDVALRFVPNGPDDPAQLRDGGAELAVGIYGELPPEMKSRRLLTDRFVCVVRRDHAEVGARLSLPQLTRLRHIQVAPRGAPGGYIDDVLHARGLRRHVARAVPYFLTALQLAAQTDYLLIISERIAQRLAPSLGLRIVELPLKLRPYALSLVWHPRFDGDPGHRWLRDVFLRAAKEAASEDHAEPRTRLDPSRPQRRRSPQ